jgi:hypothetical protein
MKKIPLNNFQVPSQAFLSCQDYDLIDYEILQFEKKLEEMERAGHTFCPMCAIEITCEEKFCELCDKVEE